MHEATGSDLTTLFDAFIKVPPAHWRPCSQGRYTYFSLPTKAICSKRGRTAKRSFQTRNLFPPCSSKSHSNAKPGQKALQWKHGPRKPLHFVSKQSWSFPSSRSISVGKNVSSLGALFAARICSFVPAGSHWIGLTSSEKYVGGIPIYPKKRWKEDPFSVLKESIGKRDFGRSEGTWKELMTSTIMASLDRYVCFGMVPAYAGQGLSAIKPAKRTRCHCIYFHVLESNPLNARAHCHGFLTDVS